MWIASTRGFISMVKHRDYPDKLLIRARVRKDLQALFDDSRIIELAGADYRYRVLTNPDEVADIMSKLIKEIDYDNFKNAIAQTPSQDDKLFAYHAIWKTMWNYGMNHDVPTKSNLR